MVIGTSKSLLVSVLERSSQDRGTVDNNGWERTAQAWQQCSEDKR